MLDAIPHDRVLFHFCVTAPEDLTRPGDVRLVDRAEAVGRFEIAENCCMGGIRSANARPPADGCEGIVLEEVDGGADV